MHACIHAHAGVHIHVAVNAISFSLGRGDVQIHVVVSGQAEPLAC